jgi:serine/threonine-protein kinase
MITTGDDLKLADFGIAKLVNGAITTSSDSFKGTVLYMSPEQIKQKPLDFRSDLFSLAVVAFEMLCGVSPWPGKTHFELLNDIVDAPLRPLTDVNIPNLALLEQIFQKALAKNPDERYPRGEDFVQALRQLDMAQTNSV